MLFKYGYISQCNLNPKETTIFLQKHVIYTIIVLIKATTHALSEHKKI